MSQQLQIVVCAGIVPDPLQTLEPVMAAKGPGLKNEMMLPAVLDPWAASALYAPAAFGIGTAEARRHGGPERPGIYRTTPLKFGEQQLGRCHKGGGNV